MPSEKCRSGDSVVPNSKNINSVGIKMIINSCFFSGYLAVEYLLHCLGEKKTSVAYEATRVTRLPPSV